MRIQKVLHSCPWPMLGLCVATFVSCSQDSNDLRSSVESGGETVALSLSAEVSVDDEHSRAINYKIGRNANNQLIPMPQFVDNQEVAVHTIIKSSNGAYKAETLKWRYNSKSKKLVLSPTNRTDSSQDENNIVIDNFNNDGNTKWYISGLIGGTLSGTQVKFEGTRVLQGILGNDGDIIGNLNVPYAFGWTELKIDTQKHSNTRESNGSYKYGEVPSSANVKFTPLGSLITYKLGNEQTVGVHDFTPSGFTVNSNAFGDQGTFELNTSVPTATEPQVALPLWTEGTASTLIYRFASGQEPGTIGHGKRAAKAYYAWVMPHRIQPASIRTRVMIKGSSSRPESDGFKDYTKTWFTDYTVKTSRLAPGKVHQLKANATYPLYLPIQYVTDYNLAGGEGLTYTTNNKDPQPIGVRGPLRFANYDDKGAPHQYGHRNDASGYYNWYKVKGIKNDTYNPELPNLKNLQDEVDKVFGAGKYCVPTQDQWWGIYPSNVSHGWKGNPQDKDEYMAFRLGNELIRQSYMSSYSAGFSTDNHTKDAYIYAIRFKASSKTTLVREPWDYDATTKVKKTYDYPNATDDLLKCAYRFRRIGGFADWEKSNNDNLTNQLIIDVVYLGEEAVPTSLEQISRPDWWDDKKNAIISKTFPAVGYIYHLGNPIFGSLSFGGRWVYYWSSSQSDETTSHNAHAYEEYVNGKNANLQPLGFPVRLFYNEVPR